MSFIVEKHKNEVSHIFHCGDGCTDFDNIIKDYPTIKFTIVAGNCDFSDKHPLKAITTINGKRIFSTHGHAYNAKHTLTNMYYATLEEKADICLFGHTNKPTNIVEGNIKMINPGSLYTSQTYCIINFENNVNCKFYNC